VHGGFHGAWCWERLLPHLTGPAVAVDLPGRGARPADILGVTLDDFVAAVVEDASDAGFERFVLVGHSMAGITLTETAYRFPARVAALVYVAGVVPVPGSSAADLFGTPWTGSFPVPAEPQARQWFATGMDDDAWARHRERLVDECPRPYHQPVSGHPHGVPVTFVGMELDAAVPVHLCRRMASTLPGDVRVRVISGSGHTVMHTHPEELARLINAVAAG
jgi:pimeloyl-ACP methyl ester carboxylesterase